MPDKASRTNSITTPAESEGRRREDDAESVEMVEELGDEGFDDDVESGEELEKHVRFKVGGLLRVINFFLTWHCILFCIRLRDFFRIKNLKKSFEIWPFLNFD